MNQGPPRNSALSAASDEDAGGATLAWAVGQDASDRVIHELKRINQRRRQRKFLAANVGIATLLFVAFAVHRVAWRDKAEGREALSSSIVSAPVKRTLPDGSIVELREGAEIAIDFSAAFRRVTLKQGEAHFEVAKDAERPFVVTAGDVSARAVGTAFLVQFSSSKVEVVVTHGQVAVEKRAEMKKRPTDAAAEPHLTLVAAGRRVVVGTEAGSGVPRIAEPVSAPDLAQKLAWRVPRLEFLSTPLAQVVSMFNRYGDTRLVMKDPALAALQLSGALKADNIDSLLRLLELEFGIIAERRGEDILLRRRDELTR